MLVSVLWPRHLVGVGGGCVPKKGMPKVRWPYSPWDISPCHCNSLIWFDLVNSGVIIIRCRILDMDSNHKRFWTSLCGGTKEPIDQGHTDGFRIPWRRESLLVKSHDGMVYDVYELLSVAKFCFDSRLWLWSRNFSWNCWRMFTRRDLHVSTKVKQVCICHFLLSPRFIWSWVRIGYACSCTDDFVSLNP